MDVVEEVKQRGFQPGNKHGKIPKAGKGTGRKKGMRTQVIEFEKTYPEAVDKLLAMLYHKGLEGHVESATYVIDRLRGRPHTTGNLQIKGKILFSPEEYFQLGTQIDGLRTDEDQFIEEHKPKLLNEGQEPSLE